MTTRKYTSKSQQTTLTSSVTSGALTFPVVSATTLLGGTTVSTGQTFTVVIDPDTSLEEIVDITAISSNNLTVTRGVDTTSAQDHSAGAVIRHMIIGRDLREANLHIEASLNVHGISSTSAVVGTYDTQTLYNKTLSAPILTSTVENDAGISFQGATVDAYSTTLTVVDPTANRTITLPNTSGTVGIIDAVQTLTNKTLTTATLGSNLAAGNYKITGLGTPTLGTDAVTKTYADANVAAAATSAASAATSASSAATSATSAAASATTAAASVATIATYASAAATSATSAAASATAAATSASSAAASAASMTASVAAAATSATSAAASATAAATSATSAAASATAAATSATSASSYVSTVAASATAAATSAASAATSASSSLTSANSAATSASSALTSQTAAATSATSAATSATSAATTYTAYDVRYLGSKASAPTLNNQGGALIVGATYWDTTTNAMYVWSGTIWAQIATTTTYSAPTLGSTTLTSATTFTNVAGLTINSTTIPTSATLTKTSDNLSVFAATTSAQLAGVISDETGSGQLVFATLPTFGTSGIKLSGSTSGTTQLLSGATAGTSVITLPIATDTLVGKATTDTLTNKTLTTPTINGATISGTFTSTATISGGTGNNLTLTGTVTAGGGVGTNGYYLQTTGTGVQWAAVAGYTAPTLGSTTLTSGGTITTVAGLTLTAPTINAATVTGTVTSTATISGGTHTNLTLSGTLTAGSSSGTSGQVLTSTGTGVQWATSSGGAQLSDIFMLMGA